MKVKVYSTSKHPLPQYATKQSAGLDLRANIDAPITINPRERVLVPTGIEPFTLVYSNSLNDCTFLLYLL